MRNVPGKKEDIKST